MCKKSYGHCSHPDAHKINVDNKKFNLLGILSGEHHRKNVITMETSRKERYPWIEGRKLAQQLRDWQQNINNENMERYTSTIVSLVLLSLSKNLTYCIGLSPQHEGLSMGYLFSSNHYIWNVFCYITNEWQPQASSSCLPIKKIVNSVKKHNIWTSQFISSENTT